MRLGPPTLLLVLFGLLPACATPPEPSLLDDEYGRADVAPSKDELLRRLAGFADPLSLVMRQAARPDGTIAGGLTEMLDRIGAQLDCDASTERRFTTVSNDEHRPEVVIVRCGGDPDRASGFFAVVQPFRKHPDLDVSRFRMSAWDPMAGIFRHAAFVTENDGVRVDVAPGFCIECHGGPQKLGSWTPIMHEMTRPWSNWNAEARSQLAESTGMPFQSQLFDEYFDHGYLGSPGWKSIVGRGAFSSASELEPVIRSGMERVAGARGKARNRAANLEEALMLLRPLFCDETYNYVSEDRASGALPLGAAVDEGIAELYRMVSPDRFGWRWLDGAMNLPAFAAPVFPVQLIAVRGELTRQLERNLVSRGVLTAMQALRVRAFDWSHPVRSDARCQLYLKGRERLLPRSAELVVKGQNGELAARLFDELMKLEEAGRLVSLQPADAEKLFDLPSGATQEADLAGREATLEELGDRIDAYVKRLEADATRVQLHAERARRDCQIQHEITFAPILPNLTCP